MTELLQLRSHLQALRRRRGWLRSITAYSAPLFVLLWVLAAIFLSTPSTDRLRLVAVSLVGAGAIGNIIDRLRFKAGVVDFLDIGIGAHRWWVFNIADSAVTVGAILLLVSFLLEERRERSSSRTTSASGDGRQAGSPAVEETGVGIGER